MQTDCTEEIPCEDRRHRKAQNTYTTYHVLSSEFRTEITISFQTITFSIKLKTLCRSWLAMALNELLYLFVLATE